MPTDLHLVIANKAYSSWSLRPWLAMKVNGLEFRETVICLGQDATSAEIKRYSAAGKVPVLKHGDITVWESLAILDYLAEAFFDRHWWPTDPQARAMARAISAEMHAGFTTLRANMTMNVRRHWPDRGRVPGIENDIARITDIWRDARGRFGGGGPFLFGKFSNADAMYAPVVTRFKTYAVDLDPVCQAYCDAVLALPAMKQWYTDAAAEPWVVGKYELE
ncbi:MAG: glutathione S-transferase family protein [Rhodospirillaceae bacterium]|nr:MAG: glutathione S-transferase family protein [Rhodospirillaceae bacterium]